MLLKDFFDYKNNLFDKVCYRQYKINGSFKTIIVNIKLQTTSFLEDISSELFVLIASSDEEVINEFCIQNDIAISELEDFIEELIECGVLNSCTDNQDIDILSISNGSEDEGDIIIFQEVLYNSGFLFNTHIDITYVCNLRCQHCYHDFDNYEIKDVLEYNQICKYIDDVYELGCFSVTLSGGEIFCRSDIWEILDYIHKKGMIITLFSNGTLINENIVDKLSKYNIYKIGISLYAYDSVIHNNITKDNKSYDNTMNALMLLKKLPSLIEVKCVLMKDNFCQYKILDDFCRDNNFSLILDTSMTPMLNGDNQPINLAFNEEQIAEFSLDENFNYDIRKHECINWEKEPCSAGRYSIYCSPSGDIFPCVSLRLHLGKACDVIQIWNKSVMLKKWQNTKVKDFKGCGQSSYCNFCFEICAGVNLLENNDYLDGITTNCNKARIREKVYINLSKR